MATPASSGDPRDPVPHIALKPQAPGIETNLTIYTTRHIYHLILRSRARAMQEVEFYYPEELLTAMNEADDGRGEGEAADRARDRQSIRPVTAMAASTRSRRSIRVSSTSHTRFSGPNVPWSPVRAFDDGSHVYHPDAGRNEDKRSAGAADRGGRRHPDGQLPGARRLLRGRSVVRQGACCVAGRRAREQDRVTIAYSGGAR